VILTFWKRHIGWKKNGDLAVSRLGGGRAGSTLSTWFDLAHHRPLKTGALTAGLAGAVCFFIVPECYYGLVAVVLTPLERDVVFLTG